MKFNLRDLFWLILVSALAASWWCERQAGRMRDETALAELHKRIAELESENASQRATIDKLIPPDPK